MSNIFLNKIEQLYNYNKFVKCKSKIMGFFSILGTIIAIAIVIVVIIVNDNSEFKPFRERIYAAGYGLNDAPVMKF